jgi:acetyl esterase/lipase
MRTRLRLFVMGTIVLVLLAGTGGAIVALADETDPSERPAPQRGVVYGDDDPTMQVIHVYGLEPREAPRPALILIHGGALVIGSPADMASKIPSLLDQGYVIFNVGYRLFDPDTGANPWPAQLEDVQRAVQWVRAHADEYNVDPARICALGHSSGGQLAGLLGTTDVAEDDDAEFDGISSRVDCVVSLAGDADLLVPYDNSEYDFTELTGMILGATVEERPDIWEAASPAHNVDEDTVPFLVIQGTHDRYVPVEMARNLVEALHEAERDVVYAEYETMTHEGVMWHRRAWGLIKAFLAGELYPER